MELILSLMAVGAFCVIATILEALIGNDSQLNTKTGSNKQHNRRHK